MELSAGLSVGTEGTASASFAFRPRGHARVRVTLHPQGRCATLPYHTRQRAVVELFRGLSPFVDWSNLFHLCDLSHVWVTTFIVETH